MEGAKPAASSAISQAKGIAAILVVYLHTCNYIWDIWGTDIPSVVFSTVHPVRVICETAVPLFYILSAYFLFRKELHYGENVRKKIKTLVIPYFFWNLFWLCFYTAMEWKDAPETIGLSSVAWGSLLGVPFGHPPVCVPFWFMRDLFLMNLAAPVFQFVAKKWPVLGCIAALLLWFSPLDSHIRRTITFFFLGAVAVFYPAWRDKLKEMPVWLAAALLLAAVPCVVSAQDVLNRLAALLLLVTGFYWSGHWSKLSPVKSVVKVVYPHIFVIYAMHYGTLGIVEKFYGLAFGTGITAVLIGYFVIPVIAILLCVLCSCIFKRLLPRLYALAVGGR